MRRLPILFATLLTLAVSDPPPAFEPIDIQALLPQTSPLFPFSTCPPGVPSLRASLSSRTCPYACPHIQDAGVSSLEPDVCTHAAVNGTARVCAGQREAGRSVSRYTEAGWAVRWAIAVLQAGVGVLIAELKAGERAAKSEVVAVAEWVWGGMGERERLVAQGLGKGLRAVVGFVLGFFQWWCY